MIIGFWKTVKPQQISPKIHRIHPVYLVPGIRSSGCLIRQTPERDCRQLAVALLGDE